MVFAQGRNRPARFLTGPRRTDDIPIRFLQGQDASVTRGPCSIRTLNAASGLQNGRKLTHSFKAAPRTTSSGVDPGNSQRRKYLNFRTPIFQAVLLGLLTISGASSVLAQQTGYSQTNLVANQAGVANHTDPLLSNPWGISFIPGQPFWIANNNGGTSTIYDAQGNTAQAAVTIPVAAHNPCPQGCPTGTVANTQTGIFGNGAFLFDTEDGIIANWTGQGNAVTVVDNSANGAVYKGLALVTNSEGTFLLAANFNSGKIDVFDRNFNATHLVGNLTDPSLPAGYAPHGIRVLGNLIMVAYAQQDTAKHDPVTGASLGVVDGFDLEGNFHGTFVSGGNLNAPWGIASAPATFGDLANDILIGNFGDGTINAYDTQGHLVGQVKNSAGQLIAIPGLWDLVFGQGGTGDPNTLYFTAGGSSQTNGLFGSLVPAAAAGRDFSLSLSAPSATVTAGGSTTLNIGSAAVGGFNNQITLSCAPAAGLTCSFNPNAITPGGSASGSVLTINAAATAPPGGGYGSPGMMLLSGLGLFGTVFLTGRNKGSAKGKSLTLVACLALLATGMIFMVACGSSSKNTPPVNQATLTVTGTSAGIRHSLPVSVTIN